MGVDDLPAARAHTHTQNSKYRSGERINRILWAFPSICDGTAQSGKQFWGDTMEEGAGGPEVRGGYFGSRGDGAPCWAWWARPIKGGAGSNVIRGWCGRGLVGVHVLRVRVCGGLNKVGVS